MYPLELTRRSKRKYSKAEVSLECYRDIKATSVFAIESWRESSMRQFQRIKGIISWELKESCTESWTIKKAEHQRIDAFQLWCWRRLLRVLWTARRSNQSILKEISPKCSLEGLMLKLKLLIFWPPDVKSWLIRKDLDAGRDWGQKEKGTTGDEMVGWHHRLDGHGFGWTPGIGDGQGGLACCGSWGRKRVGHNWATELNWTDSLLGVQ